MSTFFIYLHNKQPLSESALENIAAKSKFFPWVITSKYQSDNVQIIYTHNKNDTLDIFIAKDSNQIAVLNGYISEKIMIDNSKNAHQQTNAQLLYMLYRKSGISSCIGLNGMYNFFVLTPNEQCAEIASDRLGLYQTFFSAINQKNSVLTSSIAFLKSLPGYSPKLSKRGLFDLLYMGIAFEEYTILENVVRLLPNSSYQINKERLKLTEEKTLPFSEKNWGVSQPSLLDELEYRYTNAVKRLFKPEDRILCLQSGGKDSRLYSYIFKKAGISPECITLGEEHHAEVFLAREVSQVQNFPWRRLPICRNSKIDSAWAYLGLDSFSRRIFPLSTFENISKLPQDCDYVTAGYLADQIIGGGYLPDRIKPNISEEEKADYYLNFTRSCFLSPEKIQECFRGDIRDYIKEYKTGLINCIQHIANHPYHQMHGLWLRTNGRFKVGGSVRALAAAGCLRIPPLDNDLMNFAFSLPPSLLFNRLITDILLTKKCPRLAAIPLEQYEKYAKSLIRSLKNELKYKVWKNYNEKVVFPFMRLSGYSPVITSQFYVDTFSLHSKSFQKIMSEALNILPRAEGILNIKNVEKLIKTGVPKEDNHIFSGSAIRSLITVIFAINDFNP
ncbi:MAG: hypothetical protein COV72_02975 [Candidatus Omnitrophica bacterium CG11_big_fil_rev_8_21_14_0_20_42_13]|uniref:asparagine synthase (glutamine-hydrolyzing) n=1 Tax=Candidatus Ghiorseimicrobium undicola TaxID=1974746 RepID=A0A2H0LYN2_9BACT|nr:MAG: hypothetical protein COV72_02975 [Candidatus Omnitrophica bacterium CG11_big_fil_rev_8_21_14_0_20_42_13]